MTQMLASVVDAVEARIALDGGADILDVSGPGVGPVGAVLIEAIAAAVQAAGKAGAISAALASSPYDRETLAAQAQALAGAGADTLRLAAEADALDRLHATLTELARQARLVGVLYADRDPDFGCLDRLAALGFRGALLDIAGKDGKRLFDHLPPPRIEAFCRRCRTLGLEAWLAGGLQGPDVPRLMLLDPDVLCFRSALCPRGRRGGPLDPKRVALIRDLVPRDLPPASAPARAGTGPETSAAARQPGAAPGAASTSPPATAGSDASADPHDTIFVRDFLTTALVGAYAHERGAPQRLRFTIDAEVSLVPAHADEMRAVVSYDIILDAVRLVVGRGHFEVLETVAEDVAAIILKHPRVRQARVRIEKLDVVQGAVGVEIVRRR